MPLDPDNDPNEAYEIEPIDGPPAGWWTVTCNGIPVYHFSPRARSDAERYCRDPEYRKSLLPQKFHDR